MSRPCDCTLPKLVALVLGLGLAGGAAAQARELAPITVPWPLIALIVIGLVGLCLVAYAVVRPLPPDDWDGVEDRYSADDVRDPSREVR